jgi:hypothetical protein
MKKIKNWFLFFVNCELQVHFDMSKLMLKPMLASSCGLKKTIRCRCKVFCKMEDPFVLGLRNIENN